MSGRRLVTLLVICAAIGIPAVALRAACAGKTCASGGGPEARVPFCPLPDALKTDLAAGFRQGRSPDVFGVTNGAAVVVGGTDPADGVLHWPSIDATGATDVPIVFSGTGVDTSTAVPAGTGLDQIAPTIADVIRFKRPFPGVRAGVSVTGIANGTHPRLVLEIALRGLGTQDIADAPSFPFLYSLLHDGTGTLSGTTGSLPLDPAATLTTIGTGGLPSQHGITGSYIRNDAGDVVRAWGDGAPLSVIATLPDDLDERTGQRAKVGLVETSETDRGLIGGNWYPQHDHDAIVNEVAAPVAATRDVLNRGFGRDDVPDILGVVLDGTNLDARMQQIVALARRASNGSLLIVVAGTGSNSIGDGGRYVDGKNVVQQVEDLVEGDAPIVEQAVAGGLFLNQATLASEQISGDAAVQALLRVTSADGQRMMADAFQGFAVSFARYC